MSFFIGNPSQQIITPAIDPLLNQTTQSQYTCISPNGYGSNLRSIITDSNGTENTQIQLNVVNNNTETCVLCCDSTSMTMNTDVVCQKSYQCTNLTCSKEIDSGDLNLSGSLTLNNTNGNTIYLPTSYTTLPPTVQNFAGYYISNAPSADVALSSTVIKNLSSINLQPGVWIIISNINFSNSVDNTSVWCVAGGISTSDTSFDTLAYNTVYNTSSGFVGSYSTNGFSTPTVRFVSLLTPTTFYLNAQAFFSSGTLSATGLSHIDAVRIA